MNKIIKALKNLITFDSIKKIESSLELDGIYKEINRVLTKIRNQKTEYQEKREETKAKIKRLEVANKTMANRLEQYSELEDKFEKLIG
ncbi:MAG: hypothetical protein ACOCRO_02545 [Halanaerobiales bacterium]